MSDKQLQITARPNPVQEPVSCLVQAGQPISELFPDISPRAQVEINGELLRRQDYDSYPLAEDDIVVIRQFPAGDTDARKDVGRTVALIAVAVASAAVGNYAGTAWGFSQLGATLVSTAAYAGGAIAVNALLPPSQINNAATDNRTEFNRLGALTGSRNRLAPYGAVPRVYGKHRLYPPLAAKPYTEVFANTQYLRCLFCAGYGPLKLSDPKIGDTAIGSFDANNDFTSNGNFEDIQIEVAEEPSLFSNTVVQDSVGVDLNDASDSAIRSTSEDTDEFSIEIIFPQGLFGILPDGQTSAAHVDFLIELRETGTATWEPASDGSFPVYVLGSLFSRFSHQGSGVWRANNSARETLRVGMSLEVDPDQYDIRITRQTAEGAGDTNGGASAIVDGAQWSVLRSIKHSNPTDLPGTVMIAMKVKATDQINGILDDFSVVAESRLATYDDVSETWDEPVFDSDTGEGTGGSLSANPAWVLADVLTGGANARGISKSRLDGDALKDWADWCDTEGFEYNGVIDSKTTVLQLARSVAAAGRASYGLQDGQHTIVRDLAGQTPVQKFTPRNSWGFSSSKTFLDNPHGLKVRFRNEASDWKTEEAIVYNDGYSEDGTGCLFDDGTGVCKTATRFETLELDGVTDWDQAWRIGRYRLAEARLRPEVYTLNVDVENLVCQRGDRVMAAHDVTLWGSRWGRLISVTRNSSDEVTHIRIDEPAEMEAGNDYQIRVRLSDGTFQVIDVDTQEGEKHLLAVTTPAAYDIARGDLFAFGEEDLETVDLKVIAVEPQPDLSARLTLVDGADAIHDADSGTIPAFDPQITDPPELLGEFTPPLPVITNVRSNGNALYRDADSAPHLRIIVSFTVGDGFPTELVEGRYRKDGDSDGWTAFGSADPNSGSLTLKDVERGADYIIQIRSRAGERTSRWVQAPVHTVGSDIRIPGDESKAIGHITADIDGKVTSVAVELYGEARQGIDYYVVNQLERELYTITPTADAGPGTVSLAIEEQVIDAPEGSYVVKVPGQEEIEQASFEDRIAELNETQLPELNEALDFLNNDVLSNPEDRDDFVKSLVTYSLFADRLVTNQTFTDKLSTNKGFIERLTANFAFIRDLFSKNIQVTGQITNEAGTFKLDENRIESRSFYSEEFEVADDDFVEIGQTIDDYAFVMVQSDTITRFAIFSVQLQPSVAITKQLDATSSFETAAGEPTGTSGTDGDTTFFGDGTSNKIWIENRSGTSQKFKILLIN